MKTFFTSDFHLGHKNILHLSQRPFKDLHEMHRTITDNWNEAVGPNDIVWVLGDFAFCNSKELKKYTEKLQGRKRLIIGNHDKIGETAYLDAGFELVLHQAQIKIHGHYVNLSHYPYRNTPEELQHAEENGYQIKYLDRRMINDGLYLLHGHTHNKNKQNGKQIHVGIDAWDFKPVSLSEIESMITRHEAKLALDNMTAINQDLGLYDDEPKE